MPNMMSPQEFYQFKKDRGAQYIKASEQQVFDSGVFPDWLDMATQKGARIKNTLGVSGGGENSRYYVSTSYENVEGVAIGDKFKRLSTRVNLETNITNWLTYGTNTQLAYNDRSGEAAYFDNANGAYKFNPLTRAYDPLTGELIIFPYTQNNGTIVDDAFFANPLSPTQANSDDKTYKIITNNFVQVDFPFVKGLSYRLNTGLSYTNRDRNTYWGRNTKNGFRITRWYKR